MINIPEKACQDFSEMSQRRILSGLCVPKEGCETRSEQGFDGESLTPTEQPGSIPDK